jgi:hypothetical protein
MGEWSKEESIKLKDAVQNHGDKDWVAISALVPNRTKKQCYNRWNYDRANGRKGKWTEVEDTF